MVILLIIITAILFICIIVNNLLKRAFVSRFTKGNVMVSGMRGRGKDMAFCIVVNARKRNYISNIQYSSPKKKFQRFDFDPKVWELANNTYENFIEKNVSAYTYPYPDNIDYYISDAGIYFPSQYQDKLCKKYPSAPVFQALSRHLGDCNIHCNSQKQNRVWDKIREQSDIFIVMKSCKVFRPLKLAFIHATEYALEESAEKQIKPPHFGLGKLGRQLRADFVRSHGEIKQHYFICRIPYNYDSRRFKKILENNCVDYEESE